MGFHHFGGVYGQCVGGDAAGRGVHDLGGRGGAQVCPGFDAPAQVAVGKDALNVARSVHDGGAAQALGAHLAHQVAEAGFGAHAGHLIATAHHVAHMGEQFAAQRAAGVRAGKVFGAEAPGVEQGHGQCVAHGQLGGGAGGGGQVQRAGFALHAAVQHQVGMLGQGGLQTAGQRDQGCAQALEHGQDGSEFTAFAAVGDGQHHIGAGDHAQIAVAGLCGVHKECGGAGGRQGGGNLAAHMAALAHAHHHQAAGGGQHHLHGLGKALVHPGRQARERGGFDFKGLARQAQGLRRVKRRGRGGADSHGRILSTGAAGGLLPGLSAVLLAAPVRSALPSAPLPQRQARKLVTLG